MPTYFKKKTTVFLNGLIIAMTLTAFGCKQEEADTNTTQSTTTASESITYDQAENINTITSNNSSGTEENNTDNNSGSDDSGNEESNASVAEDEEEILLSKAEKIAEIYGTFTNKDKEAYKNLKDLKEYSTDKLGAWIDETSRVPVDSKASFYGVTTSALSSMYLDKDDAERQVLITVKKEEFTSNSNTPKISYKVILAMFNKIGGEWKLNGIYWQN